MSHPEENTEPVPHRTFHARGYCTRDGYGRFDVVVRHLCALGSVVLPARREAWKILVAMEVLMRRTCVSPILVALALCVASVQAQEASLPSLPSLSPAAMEDFLLNAELSDIRDVGTGVTGSQRAVASDGRLTHDVHIQSVDIRRAAAALGDGRIERNFRDSYAYNIAAYRVAVLLGMDNVPMSVPRDVRGERAAVTWWVDDVAMTEGERAAQRTYGPDAARTVEQFYTMYVFDELIQNRDRNHGNMLWTSDWKMWLIDHTRAFRPQVELTEPVRLTRISRVLLDNLRTLTSEALEDATSDFLSGSQRSRLLQRRDLLVQHFEERIGRLGASMVVLNQ